LGKSLHFLVLSNSKLCILTNHCILSLCLQSESHEDQECNDFQAYCMAHMGRATSDVSYNPADPPEAYSNPSVHNRLTEYTSMARDVHGPDYDPTTEDLDGEVVMRAGGGKKHGRYWIADGAIDSAATPPPLSQSRASSTSASPTIRPRQGPSQQRIEALQARLEQETKLWEDMEARMEAMAVQREAEQQRMTALLQYMQAATGVAPPPALFAPPPMLFAPRPPPPPQFSTPNSAAASNDPNASPHPLANQRPSW